MVKKSGIATIFSWACDPGFWDCDNVFGCCDQFGLGLCRCCWGVMTIVLEVVILFLDCVALFI